MPKTKKSVNMIPMKSIIVKKKLEVVDVFCIACESIYLRPVTMPCGHTFCLKCFKSRVYTKLFECPMCHRHTRLRRFKQDWDSLVNENLWSAVQQKYPVKVEKRLNEEDDGLKKRTVGQGFTRIQNKTGQIKKEFDDMRVNCLREEEEMEFQNVDSAKKLEKEEAAERILNEKIFIENTRFARAFIFVKMLLLILFYIIIYSLSPFSCI